MEKKELTFKVDPLDFNGMLEVMDKYGESDNIYHGVNENLEDVTISVFHDHISITTYQSNGRVRKNIYWRDGTNEELFDGK